jgi:hypothetical protein
MEFPTTTVDDKGIYDLRAQRHVETVLSLCQEIGLFEFLADRPSTIVQIADHLTIVPRAAEALVAVAAAAGYLNALGDQGFGLTQLAETYLLSTSPFYRRINARPDAYEELKDAVNRGDDDDPGGRLAVDMGTKSVEEIRSFIDTMHTITLAAAGGLAKLELFKDIHRLLDIAGGSGSIVSAIAAHNPHTTCTLLDLAPVCKIAEENIQSYGLSDRISTHPADMFGDTWPGGHDALHFGNIFHDWDRNSCSILARRAFDSLEPGGHILLHEMPLNETKDGPLTVACFSVSMLIYEKGKQYTLTEFESILSEAGFADFRSVPSFGYYHLISGKKC